ncbi:hypothetical protein D3C86_449450 [compost metagenome]
MNLTRLGLAVGVPVALGILVACGALPPGITPGNESLAGRVTFNNQAPPQRLTVRLRNDIGGGTFSPVVATTAQTNANGDFAFQSLGEGTYQPYWDDEGQITSDPGVNTAGIAAPDAVRVTSNQTSAPNVTFDVAWPVNPNPTVNGAISLPYSFSWAPKPNLPGSAEYQVLVTQFNKSAGTRGAAVWSSGWNSGNSVSWNGNAGTETNSPTGARSAAGDYVYQVKYRKTGGSFGGGNFFGQTKWIPFRIQ